ncbi:AraC family transcriptional regulator [Mycobacterium aquaticum]|uniref:AraC family transcriptional regulator n=2 Tax=Mycobacterium aquaticum TaxID=1927124 RepID=A0A1W9ZVH9_9MYCO|nr:AraC family transcriptional regulator [Mycobacterium aquaticum]
MTIGFVTQQFEKVVDWSFSAPRPMVLVWRRGEVSSKEVDFELSPAKPITPHPSTVWVIPAGQRSAAQARDVACEFAQLTLSPTTLGHTDLRPVAGEQDPFIHQLIEKIAHVAQREDVLARLLKETLAQGLSLHIRDQYGQLPSAPSRARALDADEQRRLIEFLHDSLDTDIDIPSLAELVGMSVHGFRRAFIRTFGVTPYRYVLDQRVQRAKTLLATTTLPVTEVSIALGFATPSHFTTMFKQRVGVTPTVYRRNT